MKIGIVAPLSVAAIHGGVRTQALMTAKGLQDLGHEVHFISPWDNGFSFDLVHIFSAGPETIGLSNYLAKQNIPFVLSPVFYSTRSASFIALSLYVERLLSKAGSGIRSDFGIKSEMCKMADLILPNTSHEALLIAKGLVIDTEKITVIPNGVEERFAEADPELFSEMYSLQDFVLCVAQAGAPRKNVKLLLQAAPHIPADIVVAGAFDESTYSKECLRLAAEADNVHLIGHLDHDDPMLSSAYAACHTFVLPSYYETPGIAALEAALAGAHIVITRYGGTVEYFGDMASYIEPDDALALAHSVQKTLDTQPSSQLKQHILESYTWNEVARQTETAYGKLIS